MNTKNNTIDIKLYDYENNESSVTVEDKPIEAIVVNVVSGDEVAYIYYEDGTRIVTDSCDNRDFSYLDESYLVKKDQVKQWINFEFKNAPFKVKGIHNYFKSAERAAYFTMNYEK